MGRETGDPGDHGEMPQTRRRLVRRNSCPARCAASRWNSQDLILPILRATSFLRKSTRSQVSCRNLILSGMSAPSMQLFDTWYFLFSLSRIYVERNRPATPRCRRARITRVGREFAWGYLTWTETRIPVGFPVVPLKDATCIRARGVRFRWYFRFVI